MYRFFVFLFLVKSTFSYSQNVPVIKINDLEKRIQNHSDTTYIVNFWATWCVPCIKELPDFDSIQNTFKNSSLKVLLISLDFKEDIENKLLIFIKNKKVKSEILLLDETNGNYFIPKIANEWTGAIPATLIVNNKYNKRYFFEKKIDYNFLKQQIDAIDQPLINKNEN